MSRALRTVVRRAGLLGAAALSLALAGAVPLPAHGDATPAPEAGVAHMVPTTVGVGDDVVVESEGWKPGAQLQAVVCGDNAVGGSNACDMVFAVTSRADTQGRVRHAFTMSSPPRPCPCVVRIATFTAPAMAMNVPFTLEGHPTGTPPEEKAASSDLRVDAVEMKGRGGPGAFLGIGGTSTMVITLANRGDAPAPAPDVAYGFGRGGMEPVTTVDPGVVVQPGATQVIEVDVDVPALAFGGHRGVAQWADGTGSVESDGFTVVPVGVLAALVSIVLVAVVVDLRRRRERLRGEVFVTAGAHRFLDDDGTYPLPDVVYLEDIGGYLVKPVVLKNSRVTKRLTGRVRVSDLALLVVAGDDAVASYPDGTPVSKPAGGSGGISLFLRWDRDNP